MATDNEDFDFRVANRVHIMPIGYEEQRAYLAAKQLKADYVVLIGHVADTSDDGEHLEAAREGLDDAGIEHEIDECDIFDMYGALGKIAERIDDFADEDVYVNVATGGKITAIAGMIACMVTGATPYYVQAENYDVTPPEGIAEITQLPRYPIEAPDAQHIEILRYIRDRQAEDNPPTKGDLINHGEDIGLPFIGDYDVEEKSKYRLLDNQVIDPMTEDGYVTVRKSGREKVVEITDDGEKTLQAFRYLIDNGYDEET